MAIDERARHRLFERLEAVLGPDEAAILMEHLPPVGWADVATKRDLDALDAGIRHELAANRREHDALEAANRREHDALEAANRREHDLIHQDIEGLRGDILHQTRTMVLALSTALVSVGALAFAAARLT